MSEFDGSIRTLIIIDDLMSESSGSDIAKLFTKGSHHRNISLFFVMQNFFHQSKEIRTITLNAHYVIWFKNPRDTQQIKPAARQMYGSKARVMEDAFERATEEPHGYLLGDFKQGTPDALRLRSRILPTDYALEIYVDKALCRNSILEIELWRQ